MYQAFFGLREKPFNLTPDPKFLYLNSSYREALASLHYAIAERKGFAALIGEAGTGKTTLLRRLLSELTRDTRSVLVINPAVSFEELLRFILADLGRPPMPGTSKLQMMEALNAELLDTLARGGNVVVLIDEAQDLTIPVLEELRLLSNLETAKEKILQFVLAGQPELESMLARPEIRQLRQRIAVNARLRSLGRSEVRAYVAARVAAAGGDERGLFRPAALHRLWRFSRGVPRLVNVACDNALVTAYAAGQRAVGRKTMSEAVRDLLPASRQPGRGAIPALRLGMMTAAAILGACGTYVVLRLVATPEPVVHRSPAAVAAQPAGFDERLAAQDPGVFDSGTAASARSAAVPSRELRDSAYRSEASSGREVAADRAAQAASEPQTADLGGREATVVAARQPASWPRVPAHPSGRELASTADTQPGETRPSHGARKATPPTPGSRAGSEGTVGPPAQWQAPPAGRPSAPSAEPPAAASGVRHVRVERGDTITALAQRHYGYVTPGLLDAIKAVNPELRDLDVIMIGRIVALPPVDRVADGRRADGPP